MKYFEDENQFVKGMISGLIAGIVMYFFVEAFYRLGVIKYGLSYLAGETVFTYKNNLAMNLIAFMVHSGVGIFWGIILSFIFTKIFTGRHYLLKMLFFCFCIFFFHLGFLDEPFHYKREIHKATLDLLIILAGYLLYGVILAIVFKKYGIIQTPSKE
jgi:hypothetical protein